MLVCLLVAASLGAASATAPRVDAPAASYIGVEEVLPSGRRFYSFSGIRYAKPPLNELKFKEAELVEDTPGVEVDATVEGPDCLQIDPIDEPDVTSGEEDCLYMNVYTPTVDPGAGLPVMVWVHGGTWRFGTGSRRMYGPEPLMSKDIVLVTFNYRLGPLGFSSLETDLHPGNLGLKDQRTALLFVGENIKAFGGDPGAVTLFGQSAGAASVHYHMLSPRTRGLFRRGISMSGTAQGPWAIAGKGHVRQKTLQLAELLGCQDRRNDTSVMACLSKAPARELVAAQFKFDILDQELVIFRPVVESDGGESALVPVHPSLATSYTPWLQGFTSSEAAFFAVRLSSSSGVLLRTLGALFDLIAPKILMYEDATPDLLSVTDAIREYYLHGTAISVENIRPVIDMMSDSWFVVPSLDSAQQHNGTLYSYVFDHKGALNVVKAMGCQADFGVSHGDDVPYVFNNTKLRVVSQGSDTDRNISTIMVDLWTNFAIHGTPTVDNSSLEWSPWSPQEERNLRIGSEDVFMEDSRVVDRWRFWRSLGLNHSCKCCTKNCP